MEEEECTQCTIYAPARTTKNKEKITISLLHFLIKHLSLVLCLGESAKQSNSERSCGLKMILFCDMYSPCPALFPMCYLMRLWCICDVLFDAHQMFIFPSPDGGTWLFLREILGDRGGGGASMFHKILKKQTGCEFSKTWVFLSWACDFEVWKAQRHFFSAYHTLHIW